MVWPSILLLGRRIIASVHFQFSHGEIRNTNLSLRNSCFPLCIKLIASYVREKVLPFLRKRPWVLSLAPQREQEEPQPSDCYCTLDFYLMQSHIKHCIFCLGRVFIKSDQYN